MKLETYHTQEAALRGMTESLIKQMGGDHEPFHLALSGASTAQKMYRLWRDEYRERIEWDRVRFYWVDERCVAPTDDESNYKHAAELLFAPLNIPENHIYRIHGECPPEVEAERYSESVKSMLSCHSCLPKFDCVILGIGEDGHTASIFPTQQELLTDWRCYAVAEHPQSGQKRITMTGELILNSSVILVPVLGENKRAILNKIVNPDNVSNLPAAYIVSKAREAVIYTDTQVGLG